MRMHRSLPAIVVVLALAVAACGSSDAKVGAGDETTTTAAETTTTAAEVTTTTASGTAPAGAADYLDKSGPAVGTDVALLTAVRVARNDGFDRIVFEFQGANLPKWSVGYAPGPFSADPSGEPLTVTGTDFLRVLMQGGSGVDLDTGTQTYTGPSTVPGNGAVHVTEVVREGDFEAQLSWIVGVDASQKFTVTTLTSPSRLVIDVVQ